MSRLEMRKNTSLVGMNGARTLKFKVKFSEPKRNQIISNTECKNRTGEPELCCLLALHCHGNVCFLCPIWVLSCKNRARSFFRTEVVKGDQTSL